jgi:hypothetical protein
MKKRLSALSALLFLGAIPALADPGHDGPKITRFEFAQPPVKSGIDEVLLVTAHDPNSWIHEVQVRWEDENENGGAVFADTFCVQDPDFSDPGTPAKLKIPIYFDHPGDYRLEVRAMSALKCRAGKREQVSKTLTMNVVVRDPLTTRADPDDASGVFDIASIEQTQESSETSATTEIVQRIRMFDAWSNDQLAGNAFIEMYFDLDGEVGTIERILTIDLDEDDGVLRASMLDATTGQARGYAAVRRSDDRTLEVAFPPLLLRKGLDGYRWYAFIDSGAPELCAPENPCTDRAPDESGLRHSL